MFLPNFHFEPAKTIKLGTLLLLSEETKQPDPKNPLNGSNRIPIDESKINRIEEGKTWTFDEDNVKSVSTGLSACVPILSVLGGRVALENSRMEGLIIKYDSIQIGSFEPDEDYIQKCLDDDFIRDHTRQLFRPSVYLVTGLQIARNATIEQKTRRSVGANLDPSFDATSLGVPIAFGPDVKGGLVKNTKKISGIAGPFILAYQLSRIRLKRDGSHTEKVYDEWALLDDVVSVDGDKPAWDVKRVLEGMDLRDG